MIVSMRGNAWGRLFGGTWDGVLGWDDGVGLR